MRKKLAALLCAVMCITAFTGCSSAELGYLQMSADMMKNLAVCEASGKVNVDLDVDAMRDYIADISEATGTADEETEELLKELEAFEGKKSAVVDYTLKMNMDTLEYYLDMGVTYEGKKYDMGELYFGMTDGIYLSSKTVWGMYELVKDFGGIEADSYLLDENFVKEFKATLDENKYINIMSPDEMGLTEEELANAIPEGGFGDLYESVFEFYKNAFSGFTTNMVSEVSGGYKVQADGDAVAKLLVDLIDYVGNNFETVIDATTTYMMDVMKFTEVSEEEIAAFKAEMDAVKSESETIKAQTDYLKQMVEMAVEEPGLSDILDSLAYEATVTKSGSTFDYKEAFSITHDSNSVLKVTSNNKMKAGSGKVVMPTTGISTADFDEKMFDLEEKYNPVTGVSVLWGWEGDSEAILTKERAEESFFTESYDEDITEYVVKDGRAYLPLRVICEALGETVEWNNAEKTAYVVREDGKTEMSGVLQDGKSFISVRDFEKLDYIVEFSKVDGLKEVVIY